MPKNPKFCMHTLFTCLIFFIGCLLLSAATYFSNYSMEQLLYHLMLPIDHVGNEVIWNSLGVILPLPLFLTGILWMVCYKFQRVNIQDEQKRIRDKFKIISYLFSYRGIAATLSFMICFLISAIKLDIWGFYQRQTAVFQEIDPEMLPMLLEDDIGYVIQLDGEVVWTELGEETTDLLKTVDFNEVFYVDPNDVNVEFPEEKRNLIFVFLESMEATFSDEASGGKNEVNLIPNLTRLAEENISFAPYAEVTGGLIPFYANGWTVASLVNATSGLLFQPPVTTANYGTESFLPGATTLNDILANQGYQQYFLMGSTAVYGSREQYFAFHGQVEMRDYQYAIREGLIDPDYLVFWGYEDQKLYEYAKEDLLEIAQEDAPFFYGMLTVDSHFPDGYTCPLCPTTYDTPYENALVCSDQQIGDFVSWLKEQDFYEDTTIVLVGDHLTMADEFIKEKGYKNEDRYIYNCIINSSLSEPLLGRGRSAIMIDLFPTVLSSIGVVWEGNRLGLGTCLYSDSPTLIERVGSELLEDRMDRISPYYQSRFIENTFS